MNCKADSAGAAGTGSSLFIPCANKKTGKMTSHLSCFMQEAGLEPALCCHNRHLKPARLPIPPLLRTRRHYLPTNDSILFQELFVNTFLEFVRNSRRASCGRRDSRSYDRRGGQRARLPQIKICQLLIQPASGRRKERLHAGNPGGHRTRNL